MAFNITLWTVDGKSLSEIQKSTLDKEQRLEDWIAEDPSILGLNLLIIGRQVTTENRGRIDLLAMNSQGDIVIIELKRAKTPRDIVAQVLDYASWVKKIGYKEINAIGSQYLAKSVSAAFSEHFGAQLPENVNANHSMIIVASELDESSERIVQYLSDDYNVNINAIFFNFFKTGDQEILGRAWLMDPEEVQDRAESRKQAPWAGYWYVNIGEGPHRNWEDCRKYGIISAGQGKWYSDGIKRLDVGDMIFAYQRGVGYAGYGEVTSKAAMLKNYVVQSDGQPLIDKNLQSVRPDENIDDPELCEWVVGVNWIKTFPLAQAKTFKGVFANQNIVCKLRDEETVKFLSREFGVNGS